MTSSTLTPELARSAARTRTGVLTSLRQAVRSHRPSPDRAARRAAAREIAAFPATRSASTVVLPSASRRER